MTARLSLDIKAGIHWLFEQALDLSTLTDSSKLEYSQSLADGAGAGQADKLWHDGRTVAFEAHDDLDLTALTYTLHGSTVTISFARVKAILIHNTATAAGETLLLDSSVDDALLAPFDGSATSKVQIPPDSPLLLVHRGEGWPVTADAADTLRIKNAGAGPIPYKIVIAGTST